MQRAGRRRKLIGEINVVPYIDVMLVLLVIFMVTAPLLTLGIKVRLPKSSAEPIAPTGAKDPPPLVLSIDARGRWYLSVGQQPDRPLDERTAAARAAAVLRRNPDVQVLVKGDARVPYGRVVEAMAMLQRSGARRIGFLTDPLNNIKRGNELR
jgi:biopolymer transport protein TolR